MSLVPMPRRTTATTPPHICRFNIPTCPGCATATSTSKAEHDKVLFLHYLAKVGSPLTTHAPNKAATARSQLLGRVFDVLCPVIMDGRVSVYNKILRWMSHDSKAMRSATDGLLVLLAASREGSKDLLLQSQQLYHQAITMVRVALAGPASQRDRMILYVVDALYTYSMYSFTPDTKDDWRRHTRGLAALVQAGIPGAFAQVRSEGTMVMDHLHAVVMEAVISRRPTAFGNAAWTKHLGQQNPSRFQKLVILACRLPGQLANVDACTTRDDCDGLAAKTFAALGEIQHALQEWLLDWYRSRPDHASHPPCNPGTYHGMVPAAVLETYPKEYRVYSFSRLEAALGHAFYWTLLLIVGKAIYDLASSTHLDQSSPLLKSSLSKQTSECAHEILKSTPYLMSRLQDCFAGDISICGPLLWAESWFSSIDDYERAEMCLAVVDRSKAKRYHAELVCVTRSIAAWLDVSLGGRERFPSLQELNIRVEI